MKPFIISVYLLFSLYFQVKSQPAKNVFIITTDGFRWEEVFKGADSLLINNPAYVKDLVLTKQMYWDTTTALRRQKLLPFFWNVVANQGQLYGNRLFDNKVNVSNFYKISYPGYNEMLTGYADPLPILNFPVLNKNSNVLDYLDHQPALKGKVVAFCSWNMFPFILNNSRCGFLINSGYELLNDKNELNIMIDSVQNSIVKSKTRNDQLTYLSAKEYIEKNHPRVAFLSLGETDEEAHSGRYDMYLQKASAFDKMIADLWYYIQTDSFYKNNTTILITTDHGRGKQGASWRTHGFWIKKSGEVWLAMIGPEIMPEGEIKIPQQIYQKQIAAAAANLVGEHFTAKHPVAPPLPYATPLLIATAVFTKK